MIKLLYTLILAFSFQTIAGVVKSDAKYLKTVGVVSKFEWAPDHFTSGFKFDVLYYIPKTLKDASNVKTLIFMHGGGASTMTRQGSLNVAYDYMFSDLQKLANDLETVVVVPSASGLNWSAHTSSTIRELNRLIRSELNVDHNNMGLSGHSMGGMGITRVYHYVADEFAYFNPIASGMDPKHQTEERLIKLFNTPYVQLQGKKDHFQEFITRSLQELKTLETLEKKYGEKSLFELVLYNGSHNSDYPLFKETIKRLQQNPRNIYQKNLYGVLHHNNQEGVENKIKYNRGSDPRYFWVEIKDATAADKIDFIAKINDNTIDIKITNQTKYINKLRVYLSKKMLDENSKVIIKLNDKVVSKEFIKDQTYTHPIDESFQFDDFIDISI